VTLRASFAPKPRMENTWSRPLLVTAPAKTHADLGHTRLEGENGSHKTPSAGSDEGQRLAICSNEGCDEVATIDDVGARGLCRSRQTPSPVSTSRARQVSERVEALVWASWLECQRMLVTRERSKSSEQPNREGSMIQRRWVEQSGQAGRGRSVTAIGSEAEVPHARKEAGKLREASMQALAREGIRWPTRMLRSGEVAGTSARRASPECVSAIAEGGRSYAMDPMEEPSKGLVSRAEAPTQAAAAEAHAATVVAREDSDVEESERGSGRTSCALWPSQQTDGTPPSYTSEAPEEKVDEAR